MFSTLPAPVQHGRLSSLIMAGLVAFALLLQVLVAAPLAIRMAAVSALDDMTATCATVVAPAPDMSPERQVVPLHHHAACPLCDGHAVPVALPAAPAVLPPRAVAWLFLRPQPTAPPERTVRFTPYLSRAPPAAA